MTEFTEEDVTRLAEMVHPLRSASTKLLARRLLEQGVTLPPPPPDLTDVVAKVLWPFPWDPTAEFVAAVRDLFTSEALAQAAAKVQEADRG